MVNSHSITCTWLQAWIGGSGNAQLSQTRVTASCQQQHQGRKADTARNTLQPQTGWKPNITSTTAWFALNCSCLILQSQPYT